jgi:hypothetical protein
MSKTYAWSLGLCLVFNVGCSGPTLDAGDDLDESGTEVAEGKLIFRTSERYAADLGGLEGADQKCQELAEAAGRSGEFKAWLSTVDTAAWDRLTHSDQPYVLSTGVVVARNWLDLTSGTLRHRVDQAELADLPPANGINSCNPTVFWSGTDERGAQFGDDCEGWTRTGQDLRGVLGVTGLDGNWSTFCRGNCDSIAPLMCLEQ